MPCSVWPGGVSPPSCVPSWLLVKINPVLDEPRTPLELFVYRIGNGDYMLIKTCDLPLHFTF